MNRIAVAQELVRLAKELTAIEFDTEAEKKKYQQEHEVRPGTKLTVKSPDRSKDILNPDVHFPPITSPMDPPKAEPGKKRTVDEMADAILRKSHPGSKDHWQNDMPTKEDAEFWKGKMKEKADSYFQQAAEFMEKYQKGASKTDSDWQQALSNLSDAVDGGVKGAASDSKKLRSILKNRVKYDNAAETIDSTYRLHRASYRVAIASELVKLAKELTAKDERELRVMTMEDVVNDTPLLRLKVVFKGTMDEVNDHAKKKGLVWKDSRKEIFGGYWYDKDNGEAYPIT
jgi:hypothetical protein